MAPHSWHCNKKEVPPVRPKEYAKPFSYRGTRLSKQRPRSQEIRLHLWHPLIGCSISTQRRKATGLKSRWIWRGGWANRLCRPPGKSPPTQGQDRQDQRSLLLSTWNINPYFSTA